MAAVDRLTIISHDKFQEIIDHANDPNSIIRTGVIIGRDIPDTKSKVVVIESNIAQRLGIQSIGVGAPDPAKPPQPVLFANPEEQKAAQVTYVLHSHIWSSPARPRPEARGVPFTGQG